MARGKSDKRDKRDKSKPGAASWYSLGHFPSRQTGPTMASCSSARRSPTIVAHDAPQLTAPVSDRAPEVQMAMDHIQQCHVTSTCPKAYGGKLVDSLTECKAMGASWAVAFSAQARSRERGGASPFPRRSALQCPRPWQQMTKRRHCHSCRVMWMQCLALAPRTRLCQCMCQRDPLKLGRRRRR